MRNLYTLPAIYIYVVRINEFVEESKILVVIVALVAIVAIFSLVAQRKQSGTESLPQISTNNDWAGEAVKAVRNVPKKTTAGDMLASGKSGSDKDLTLILQARTETGVGEMLSRNGVSPTSNELRRLLS